MADNKLTPKQESLVLAMMTEPNFEKACERVGISRSTGYRYTGSVAKFSKKSILV